MKRAAYYGLAAALYGAAALALCCSTMTGCGSGQVRVAALPYTRTPGILPPAAPLPPAVSYVPAPVEVTLTPVEVTLSPAPAPDPLAVTIPREAADVPAPLVFRALPPELFVPATEPMQDAPLGADGQRASRLPLATIQPIGPAVPLLPTPTVEEDDARIGPPPPRR